MVNWCILDARFALRLPTTLPLFADLMFGRRPPIFVAFDVLVDRGEDVRTLSLARRKAVLRRLAKGARSWIALADGVSGQGRRLFELVAEMDLEGIVAKRLADPYAPGRTVWWKIPNRSYSQKEGRSELFERARPAGRRPRSRPGPEGD